ncbi:MULTISPECIES: sn-glycerol-3-phosphate ABC transporter ATP-binding protein UgpC [unclassified Bradyrhizobium]|uniref:ABC transporter ATP-binding protein n=1 Tax=unclassified Bradyrhizobium TaxID=2631580 RepID=UPI00247A6691|nr:MULTISPECIES: sn-glycerol-3-phosphate ABC transporter ATP-binding protein UgpC [unclassified Bradyrhizobium]WGS18136.1 sn-glycerol-3-phosphate ABC transporter ATP-binding protein UgpC [Bradyrhizobium sp. ISRA463]WGS24950.1 sn-glycerol-3-phosphate ABC transporter ATP-binding protein UgpC [Bradyrhizobium sp. ISRA464]
MASVTISNVRKSYGGFEVLHGIDLSIANGEFVVLLGPSGCGKSTLLRMVAGLEQITSGQISIGNVVVNELHPKDRNIAMVFQNYALYAHLSVFDNMAFSMQLKKRPKEEIRRKVEWAASILNLTPYLDRQPRQLSGGQRQRVAMGRAIVRDPSVFLFDEPLSNLDAKLRVQMRTEIKELHHKLSTTTVYVTHDQIEAMTMADTIVVLRDGNIEQIGKPLEIYDRPTNLFVAEFIGSPSMNFLTGEVAAEAGRAVVRANGVTLPLPPGANVTAGQVVKYGIRPEHLRPGTGNEGIPAKVSVVEPTGPEIHIYADVGGQEVCAITQDRLELSPDDAIRLVPALDRIRLFDPATGKVINGSDETRPRTLMRA